LTPGNARAACWHTRSALSESLEVRVSGVRRSRRTRPCSGSSSTICTTRHRPTRTGDSRHLKASGELHWCKQFRLEDNLRDRRGALTLARDDRD
jgi:hypothetical protein